MAKLIAFHGSQEEKDRAIANVRAHREAERLIKGSYGEEGEDGVVRGCAVYCSTGLTKGAHKAYESMWGIPRMIARLEDGLFERLPDGEWQSWPERFFQAITPGADLSRVGPEFMRYLLVDPEYGVIRFAKSDEARANIQRVADLYAADRPPTEPVKYESWRDALEAARAARERAWQAYRRAWNARFMLGRSAAAEAATAEAAATAAAEAAEAAATEAAAAEAAAAAAAEAAAEAAEATAAATEATAAATEAEAAATAAAATTAEAAAAAWGSIYTAVRVRQSKKLLELLSAAPVVEVVSA